MSPISRSPGIIFRDIAPLLRSHFGPTIEAMSGLLSAGEWAPDRRRRRHRVPRLHARLGPGALKHGKGFVPIRKKGKLPPPVVSIPYQLEYGEGVLEMQQGRRPAAVDRRRPRHGRHPGRGRRPVRWSRATRSTPSAVLIDLNLIKDFRWRRPSPDGGPTEHPSATGDYGDTRTDKSSRPGQSARRRALADNVVHSKDVVWGLP